MNRPTRVTLFFSGLTFLLASSCLIMLRMNQQQQSAMQRDAYEKQAATRVLDRSCIEASAARIKIDQLKEATARLESGLLAAGAMDKVIAEIWRLAEGNSLQTRTVRTPADARAGRYREQDVELSLSGDFSGFYQFILQLEDLKRVTRIKRMNLNKVNDRDGELEVEMTLSVFLEPEAAAAQG